MSIVALVCSALGTKRLRILNETLTLFTTPCRKQRQTYIQLGSVLLGRNDAIWLLLLAFIIFFFSHIASSLQHP